MIDETRWADGYNIASRRIVKNMQLVITIALLIFALRANATNLNFTVLNCGSGVINKAFGDYILCKQNSKTPTSCKMGEPEGQRTGLLVFHNDNVKKVSDFGGDEKWTSQFTISGEYLREVGWPETLKFSCTVSPIVHPNPTLISGPIICSTQNPHRELKLVAPKSGHYTDALGTGGRTEMELQLFSMGARVVPKKAFTPIACFIDVASDADHPHTKNGSKVSH